MRTGIHGNNYTGGQVDRRTLIHGNIGIERQENMGTGRRVNM